MHWTGGGGGGLEADGCMISRGSTQSTDFARHLSLHVPAVPARHCGVSYGVLFLVPISSSIFQF